MEKGGQGHWEECVRAMGKGGPGQLGMGIEQWVSGPGL